MEFRIDLLKSPRFEDIRADLSKFCRRSVFTVRSADEGGGFDGDEAERVALLRRLAQLTPAYLDVELRTVEGNRDVLPRGRVRGIVSWHDMLGTGDGRRLRSIMKRAASYGGLVKIATTATSPADNLTILSLYDGRAPAPIAFCMGTHGILSRVMSMERGSPISYASLPDEPAAAGQLPLGLLLALRRRFGGA